MENVSISMAAKEQSSVSSCSTANVGEITYASLSDVIICSNLCILDCGGRHLCVHGSYQESCCSQ